MNNISRQVLTNPNKCAIMVMPRHGKDLPMKQETKEEVLKRVLVKLSDMTPDEISQLVRTCKENGIDLIAKPRG